MRVDGAGGAYGAHVVGLVSCDDGWQAARLLLAMAEEDARTPGAHELAARIRAEHPSDLDFAQAVQRFGQRVPFVREKGEVFQSGALTLARGAGDCDDHFRLVYAVARAGGLRGALALTHHGADAPPGKQGPTHAVAQLCVGGRCEWAETTVAARWGEHPFAAARRLGLLSERDDVAREVRVMTPEDDLMPIPEGFRSRNNPAQVAYDAEALRRLGFLAADAVVAKGDPADLTLRRAVHAFQCSRGLAADGLLGPVTRTHIARALQAEGIGDLTPPPAKGPTRVFLHSDAREILARAYRDEFGREPSAGELDFGLAVAFFESGYGRAGAADWAALGQFASWAAEGLYNWGALQSGTPGDGKRQGRDAGRPVFFYVYPSDYEAARAMLRSLGGGRRADWLAAAATGNARAVAAVMKRHGYYEGFHVGPGKLGTNGRTAERGFKEEASDEIAEAKNIDDYAGALERFRRVVTGPGGVPDPSPAPGAGSAGGAIVAGLFVLAAMAAGAYYVVRS